MAVRTAFSTGHSADKAVVQIVTELQPIVPTLVLYFASSCYDQQELADGMKRSFPEATVVGCSTAGEILTGKMLENSIVAMAFDAGTIGECSLQPLYNISTEDHLPHAFRQFEKYHGISVHTNADPAYAGIILADGLQRAEERIMESLGRITSIPFVGASAGDDLHFQKTWVHFNGRAATDAAVLVLFRPANGYRFLKTQSFIPTSTKLVATRVDESARTVHEFNYRPASIAYAEAIGVPEGELIENFMSHPLGLMYHFEPFVRSPQQIIGTSVVFYCSVKKDMELYLLKSTDIIRDTSAALKTAIGDFGTPSAIVNFNCILRTLELHEKNLAGEYGQLFNFCPTIGFSTYGEEYIKHINQTATMLFLK
jgi:hypothetical protein